VLGQQGASSVAVPYLVETGDAMKTIWIAACALMCVVGSARAADDPAPVLLWADGAPGARADGGEPRVRIADNGEHVVSNVHQPTITPYLPDAAAATGCAVVIAPGGGHREMWSDHEGHNLARWLSERGVAAFVLLYRLANEEGSAYTVDDHALVDMQRAVRTVRARASEWGVDPQRVGVMGFSAGGELAALAAMGGDDGDENASDPVDRQGCRPDFQALIYPGRSNRFTVAAGMPPVFIVCGYEDRPDISRGMAELYLKYKEAGVPAELHIYSEAGHGFGVRASDHGAHATWPERFVEWLAARKLTTTAGN
jgi:acetyl esterase/lipase